MLKLRLSVHDITVYSQQCVKLLELLHVYFAYFLQYIRKIAAMHEITSFSVFHTVLHIINYNVLHIINCTDITPKTILYSQVSNPYKNFFANLLYL